MYKYEHAVQEAASVGKRQTTLPAIEIKPTYNTG